MSTVQGLPAHVLLVHFVVVLVPLTAILATVCALWPAARRHLVWLVAALAVLTVALVPVTTDAGEWLEHRVPRTPELRTHTHLGDTMVYFAAALLVGVALLVAVHVLERRGKHLVRIVTVGVAVVVVAAAVLATVQVYRVGESGSRSVWNTLGS